MVVMGERSPDFTLTEMAGEVLNLADALATGPVVLAFFKADCAACNLAFPYLENLRQAYPGDDWRIWGISQHPSRAAEWFARNTGVTFPLLIDGEGFSVSNAYDPPATPTIYLIDQEGTVRSCQVGMVKAELNKLGEELAAMLGKQPTVIAPPDDGKPSRRPG